MVRRATREVADFASLVQKLADQLTSPAEKSKFLQQNARIAASGTGPSKMKQPVDDDATVIPGANDAQSTSPGPTAEEIARAARLLAVHLGPIAPILVRKAALPGVPRAAFLARLTERLSDAEKERFLIDFERSR